MPTIDLPVIDLTKAKGPGRAEVLNIFYEALTTTGFFFVKGIKYYEEDELLKVTKWFFSLPDSVKLTAAKRMYNPKSSHVYRGYFPVIPGEVSHKEGYEIGAGEKAPDDSSNRYEKILCETNIWPTSDDAAMDKKFKETMEKVFVSLSEAGWELAELIAEASGQPKDYFKRFFQPSQLSTLRLLRYPCRKDNGVPIPDEALEGDTEIITADHQDTSFLTLLYTFGFGGLQIRLAEGEWLDVPKIHDALVVNIGGLLGQISNGKFKSTNHRVVATGGDRYSVPFAYEPGFHANVNIRMPIAVAGVEGPTEVEPQDNTPCNYGQWAINRRMKFAEWKAILN